MPIEPPNAVPMNLVYGRTYRMRVLYADGSRYDWGYFIPGSDTTITLVLRTVTFTDQAQIIYNHIYVEATRNGAIITVDYLDERANTVWANTTIRERNGPIVLFAPRNNNSYTINWGGANTSLGYIVTVTGRHTEYGSWGRSFILDQSFTFPEAPRLTGIFGGVSNNLLGFLLIALVILMFPVTLQPLGLIGGCLTATVLTFFGWTDYSNALLQFAWFMAVTVNLIAYRLRGG